MNGATIRQIGPAAAGVALVAAVLGALTAVQPLVLAVVPLFMFVVLAVGRSPLRGFLLIFAARTLSDSALLPPAVSTAANVAVLGAVVLMLLLGRFRQPARVGPISLTVLFLVAIGTAIGVLHYGFEPTIFGEALRAFGVIAIALLAGRIAREVPAVPFARGILAVSVPALLAVVAGGALRVPFFWSPTTGRAFGTFSHPLGAAGFMTLIALLSLFVLRQRPSALPRWTLGLAIVGTLFTVSLSGILATAAALVVYAFVFNVRIRVSWLVSAVLGTTVAFALTTTGQTVVARLTSLQAPSLAQATSTTDTNSLEWRLRNWYRLVQAWRDEPLFGHGWGTTYELIQPLGKTPHSGPVRLLVEVGLVGLLVAAVLAWRACTDTLRLLSTSADHHRRELAGLRLSVLTAVVANSVAANTMSYIPMLLLFVTTWALSGSPTLDDAPAPETARRTVRRRTPALRS